MKTRAPKKELPGINKPAPKPVRVWPRKRTDEDGDLIGTPIFYCSVRAPGHQKPLRRSTGKRIKAAAEEYAELLRRQMSAPKEASAAPQELQLELPLPPPHGAVKATAPLS